ncbi:MAG: hypothetical protein KGM92_07615, partial [Acidobacteriota bacterium]|nr:hypothetical protein [Acidobacteriota bacterium]
YDPPTGRFTVTGGEHSMRSGASVTLLGNGTVLFAGGYDGTQYLSSAEIYDTSTGTFTVIAGSLNTPRAGQSGTMLSNGEGLDRWGLKQRRIPHERRALRSFHRNFHPYR